MANTDLSGFVKIIKDFLKDILLTFPEFEENLNQLLQNVKSAEPDDEMVEKLYEFFNKRYPERFFDILYQNDKIFEDDEIDTTFLPGINFKNIWKEDITEKTRNIIWKYLQLILFSIVGSQTGGESFGDTAKFFEAIDENEFKSKLEETINQMTELFENNDKDISNINVGDLPDPEELHNHISGLLEGHLGCLAKEIAEETANEMDIDLNDVSSVGDVFQKLFKNPGKLMKIVKKVGNKLDEKLKSGELKESELLKEAQELMKKMGKTPGMKNMNNLFGQMGMPIGRKTKINQNAFQAHMQRNIRQATMRERMKQKLEAKKSSQAHVSKNARQSIMSEKSQKNIPIETKITIPNMINSVICPLFFKILPLSLKYPIPLYKLCDNSRRKIKEKTIFNLNIVFKNLN